MKSKNKPDKFKTEDLVTMSKRLFVPKVEYDENFDNCQEEEDSWVSSVLGTEDDAIYDVLSEIQ